MSYFCLMSYLKVYIHFVWSTKYRVPHLDSLELRQKVWNHIMGNAKNKGIYIDCINGYKDHCHCLISLGIDQTLSKIMQLIKGESAYWINKNNLCFEKFEWQDHYYAISVSYSALNKVRQYIYNQEDHHARKSSQKEFEQLIEKYGFAKLND
jgi:putative transposase